MHTNCFIFHGSLIVVWSRMERASSQWSTNRQWPTLDRRLNRAQIINFICFTTFAIPRANVFLYFCQISIHEYIRTIRSVYGSERTHMGFLPEKGHRISTRGHNVSIADVLIQWMDSLWFWFNEWSYKKEKRGIFGQIKIVQL